MRRHLANLHRGFGVRAAFVWALALVAGLLLLGLVCAVASV